MSGGLPADGDSASRAPRRPDSQIVFRSLGHLYLPAEPVAARVVEADEAWRLEPGDLDGLDSVVWGRAPLRGSARPGNLLPAMRRELALAHLGRSRPWGLRVVAIHRLPPGRRPGLVKNAVRSFALGGVVVEFSRTGRPWRVIDAVATAAGASRPASVRIQPSGDGSALSRIGRTAGGEAVLRMAWTGGLKDPRREASALVRLDEAGVALVPRPIEIGETAGVRWATESALPGSIRQQLTAGIRADVVRFCSSLPRSDSPATSLPEQLDAIAAAYPVWTPLLRELSERIGRDLPKYGSVVQHGDLWLGNLLVDRRGLSGVIDWDTWQPRGLPGTDLLHLLAMDERSRTGVDIGALWLARIWRSPALLRGLDGYWRQMGLEPTIQLLDAVALDWWSAQAVAALRRGRRPWADADWVERNVDRVLEDAAKLFLGVDARSFVERPSGRPLHAS